jgi:hypothetical protein
MTTLRRVSICTFTLSVVVAWDFDDLSISSFSCASSLTLRSSLANVREGEREHQSATTVDEQSAEPLALDKLEPEPVKHKLMLV